MPVGKTKDAGWQVGVSITVPYRADDVWKVLVSEAGLACWLGGDVRLLGNAGQRYHTSDGTQGEVRSYRTGDRIRLTWWPAGADHDTTVQVAIQDKGDRTGVRFHQERMLGEQEREQQRRHWKQVAEVLRDVLAAELD